MANNIIRGSTRGIFINQASLRYSIVGNMLHTPTNYGIAISETATLAIHAVISNNVIFDGCSIGAIFLSGVSDVVVNANNLQGVDAIGISLASTACKRVVISNNVVNAATVGINQADSSTAEGITITGNTVNSAGTVGIYYAGGKYVRIANNMILSATTHGIQLLAGAGRSAFGAVTDNTIAGGCTTNAIRSSTFDDVTIARNRIDNVTAGTKITIGSGSRVIIDGNSGSGTIVSGLLGPTVNAAPSASSTGTLSKKIEVFDAAGASIGFLPVYTTIT